MSADKLQQVLMDTQQEVVPCRLLLGVGKDTIGVGGAAISITSALSPTAKVIGPVVWARGLSDLYERAA